MEGRQRTSHTTGEISISSSLSEPLSVNLSQSLSHSAQKPTAPSTDRASVSAAAADYDRVVKELLYERRAQATDRLKTEEELAREERERLQNLEVYETCCI